MAKRITTKPSPGRTAPGGTFIMPMMARAKRHALPITWPGLPEQPQAVRLRIRPQPRPSWQQIQPVAFCKFELGE